ncbi:MAG: SDR family oxidoreductase [Gemmataceae bacterium]
MMRAKRMLITGASGYLGRYIAEEAKAAGYDLILWSHKGKRAVAGQQTVVVDIANDTECLRAFEEASPDVVIHAAALAQVGACHAKPELAHTVNVVATERLVELARRQKSKLLFTSTDLVFDGEKGNYQETDPPDATSVYGRTKAQAEQVALASDAIVVRPPLMFGPSLDTDSPRFFDQLVNSLRENRPIQCFHDEWRTPLDLPTAAKMMVELTELDFCGLIHMGGLERLSRLGMGQRLAMHLEADHKLVQSVSRLSIPSPEPRPKDTSLDSQFLESLGLRTNRITMTAGLARMEL